MYNYRKMYNGIDDSLEIRDSLIFILQNFYFDKVSSHLTDEFWNRFIEGNLDTKFLRKVIRSEEFTLWIELQMNDKYQELLEQSSINDNKIELFHSISCNNWIEKALAAEFIRTGTYWSSSYYLLDKKDFIFFGKFHLKDVDWFLSILLSISGPDHIRIFSNKKLLDFSVEASGNVFHYTFNKKIFT